MPDNRKAPPTQAPPPQSDRKKVFDILVIEKGKDEKSYWRNVGIAFENRDGSINLKLYMFPDLSLQIRERQERE